MLDPLLWSQFRLPLLLSSCLSAAAAGVVVWRMRERRLSGVHQQFRSERERWDLVLKASQDGIFDIDLRSGATVYSPQWSGLLGYAPSELTATVETWAGLIHEDDKARVEQELRDYLERRSAVFDTECRLRHRDGRWLWIHTRGQAIWDADGAATRLVGSCADITGRKEAEFELKESETRLRLFLDNNPALTFMKDEDGRLLYTNRSLQRVYQLADPKAVLGKLDSELWPPSLAESFRAADLRALEAEDAVEVMEQVPLPNGTSRQVLTTKFHFRDASGRKCLGGFSIDLTERLQAETELGNSEERYRELFDRNPLPAWIYSKDDFQILEVNEAACAHYGWTRAEFLHMTLRQILLPDEFDEAEGDLEERFARSERSGPWRHRRKDGSIISVELAGQDLNNAAARLVLVNDVTERRAADQNIKLAHEQLAELVKQRTAALRDSETSWRALVETIPQIVWTKRADGDLDYVSSRGAQYSGIAVDEWQGSGWVDVLHLADRPRVTSAWELARETGGRYEVECRLRSKEGEYRWFKSLGVPVRNGLGDITCWIGTCTDIDTQKRSEESLEAAVQSRTLQLAEARDKAEAATRAKSEFLASMSHEIRTPMNGVIGMADHMFDTELTSEQRIYMDTIRSSAEALLTVINDILDFSKIEAGRLELERTQFDLSTLVEESVELARVQAASKKLSVKCDIKGSVPLDLVGDPARLRQVMVNLLSNAVKFTAEGSVNLTVSREASQNQLSALRFAIRDTGIGLSPSQQSGLFQAFQQGELSTARRFGGTGLGLAICKRLVEMMGGSIGVASQAGEGSTFWFNVCLESNPLFAGVNTFKGKRISLVSEQPAAGIAAHLEGVGAKVSTFHTVAEARFTDCDLALVDALAVAQPTALDRLRSEAIAPLVVLGTAGDFKSPVREALKFAAFVQKPIRRVPLLRTVQAVLEGRTADEGNGGEQSSAAGGERAHVLLAEDNMVNQLVARVLLEKLGCRVDMVKDGVEACMAVQRNQYDLVLMDCHMPTMGGFEATERIRAFEIGNRRTPIVALTASVLQEERERCYGAGMDDFLSKPISSRDMESALERWIPVKSEIT